MRCMCYQAVSYEQVDGNLQKCVWYANLRVSRTSYANLRITLKSALVWVWLVIDRKSYSYSSNNSVGTSLDVSPHISGNINVYQMLQVNTRSRIQVPFYVIVCWYHVRLRILHRYLFAWPRVRIEQVDGNLQKCVWYANLCVGRASSANLRIVRMSWHVLDSANEKGPFKFNDNQNRTFVRKRRCN